MTNEQLAELRALATKATTRPWRVATEDEAGDNWLVCFGGSYDGHTYYVTTDHVHASELEGDACTDAKFMAAAGNTMLELLDGLAAATQRAEAAEQDAKYWRERYEYNTTDSYNARIGAALRNWAPDPFVPPSQEAQP